MNVSPASAPSYPLGRPLPAEVLVGGHSVWSRYRQYPVFSLPWLRGRSLLFAGVLLVLALMTGFGSGFALQDYRIGVLAGAHMFAAFMLMATAGPALASWVRYRQWPLRKERWAVVFAVLVGIVASYAVDMWASGYIERTVGAALRADGMAQPDTSGASTPERVLALLVNLAFLFVVYGAFGGGLALRAYFSEQRRWQSALQRDALARSRQARHDSDLRLGALQAQVEPHFLFNTLASVRALVRQSPEQAEQTLDALVDYLRATIPRMRGGDAPSTLGQQIDVCTAYLDVMRLRMGGRLSWGVDVDGGLRSHPFPPLLLITLVENAVKHGIEPLRGDGRIDVQVAVEGDALAVRVVDDGVGLQPGVGSGVGLANVREQLQARFGPKASLALRPAADGGTVADVRVPLEIPS